MKFRVLALTGSMEALLAAIISAAPAAPVPHKQSALAIASGRVRGGAIYLVTTDGKATCIYSHAADKKYGGVGQVSWSPDGRKIAFIRVLSATTHYVTCVMDADGTNVKQLTSGPRDFYPDWSPDGKHILFQSGGDGGVICVMDANGKNVKKLTGLTGERQRCLFPVWSPDGKRIAFINYRSGPLELRVANADGSRVVTLTTIEGPEPRVAWSPNGKRLAFFDGPRLCTINADGSNRKTLGEGHKGGSPVWSPDGAKIAYTCIVLGKDPTEVWVIGADGTGATQLTRLSGVNRLPRWSPDGKKLAFWHVVWGTKTTSSLYVMDANGDHKKEVWKEAGEAFRGPAWRPK